MTQKYQNELYHKLAEAATDNADQKTLIQMYFDDQFNYFSGCLDKDLEEYAENLGVDIEVYLNNDIGIDLGGNNYINIKTG